MKFSRNILVLSILVVGLGTLLWLTTHSGNQKPLLVGDALFTFAPETISSLAWDVTDDNGEWQTVRLNRQGELWRMEAPYAGVLCDRAVVSEFLDTLQALKVEATLTDAPATLFKSHRKLEVATPERRIICHFAAPSAMNLSQLLASCNNNLVTVNAKTLTLLPTTVRQFWSRAVLPIHTDSLASIEWRATGQPFTRAIRRTNQLWSVTQPFAFEPNDEAVKQALAALAAPQAIAAYIRPAPEESTVIALSETMLAAYGLDEEYAIRVTIRVKGLSEPLQLRFGKNDPTRPEHVFCLMDGRQTIVSVPQTLRTLFTESGPFASGHTELAILGDVINPEKITFSGKTQDDTIALSRQQGLWNLTTPVELPADTIAVNQLLQTVLALTGDLTEDITLNETNRLCTLSFETKTQSVPIVIACYQTPRPNELLVHRPDTNRLYTLPMATCPTSLFNPKTLNRTLLDRTILSLPADSIRRITVQCNGAVTETISRLPQSSDWTTDVPQGAYVNPASIDAWLTAFADLQAETILGDTTAESTALATYHLDTPAKRIILDLDGRSEQLRRILHIASQPTENGLIPVMIQGRPLIYAVTPAALTPFDTTLTTGVRAQ